MTARPRARKRPIRVLVAKPGLDGHDRGAKVVAAALRDAGMEVIYTGLHQTPEMIAQAAIQEDADVVGLSILSGAHMTLFPRIKKLLDDAGRGDILITGGGIIPPADMEALERQGIGKLFGPGTPTAELAKYIEAWAAEQVSGPKSFPIPWRSSASMSAGGMIPPPVIRMSPRPASSSSFLMRGKSVMCAPDRMDRPTTSASSWMAACAIISGVWCSPV